MEHDLYSRDGTQDLIARLRASKDGTPTYDWCRVHASNVQAAIDLLEQYLERYGPLAHRPL
ncbi:hypothetical protein CURE108131_25220 [Cupriavidus respiraculi]|uniref:Transposase n=2 Tax=Cupriavidus respiraculi TaxID=195930 RepID=A0ABM8XVF7_9BURK|nr:hypothetical protein LMG21510_05075 [Cupriavidus respiraculi]